MLVLPVWCMALVNGLWVHDTKRMVSPMVFLFMLFICSLTSMVNAPTATQRMIKSNHCAYSSTKSFLCLTLTFVPWRWYPWYWDVLPLIWWLSLKVLFLSILQYDIAPLYKLENLKDSLCQRSSPGKNTQGQEHPQSVSSRKHTKDIISFCYPSFILGYALLGQSRLPGSIKLIRHWHSNGTNRRRKNTGQQSACRKLSRVTWVQEKGKFVLC